MAQARYETDDRDSNRPYELVIQDGRNGDWYVSVVPKGTAAVTGVRICTSGGASSSVPGLTVAIARAFDAIKQAAESGAKVQGITYIPD